jgi:hypothetical protein
MCSHPEAVELMELDSGNLVGSYSTLEEAFVIILAAFGLYGWSGVNDLGLVQVAADGSQEFVAAGADLARRASREAGGAGQLGP